MLTRIQTGAFVLAPALLLLLSSAHAQDVSRATYVAIRADRTPDIDGVLNDRVWAEAPQSQPFVNYRNGDTVEWSTTFQAAWDDEAVYFAIRCEEPEPRMPMEEHIPGDWGTLLKSDSIELLLDPKATRSQFRQYVFNAAGDSETGFNTDQMPDLPRVVATALGNNEWILEVAIPYGDALPEARAGDRWGLNICYSRPPRSDDEKMRRSSFNPTPGGFQRPDAFGNLVFGLGKGVELNPEPGNSRISALLAEQIAKETSEGLRWKSPDMSETMLQRRHENLIALAGPLSRFKTPALLWGVRPAMTPTQSYPWEVPDTSQILQAVRIRACRGEYEPASFTVFPFSDWKTVTFTVTDLANTGDPGQSLSSSTVDIRQVVCWYIHNAWNAGRDRFSLVPELLLHNPGLLSVDPAARTVRLNFETYPRDAETLQPVDLNAFESTQFWVTAHIPMDAAAGYYAGAIVATSGGEEIARIPLEIEVFDFDLEPSPMIHSLYYTRRFKDGDEESMRQQVAMMESEIRNQVEHGINMPTTYVSGGKLPWDDSSKSALKEVCRMHRDAGVGDSPLVCVTSVAGFQQGEEALEKLRESAAASLEFAKEQGRPMFYFQGLDEASGDRLLAEYPAWKAVNEGGARVFVAIGKGFFDEVGDVLNIPVVAGRPDPDLAKKVRGIGHTILCYANPFVGLPDPVTYRRNYGLALWIAGYNGSMNWEYGPTGEDVWTERKSGNMAYPALGRPIDTVQWEGWREGVDDVRYAATLMKSMEAAETENRRPVLVADLRDWVDGLTMEDDPADLRAQFIDAIQRLKRN